MQVWSLGLVFLLVGQVVAQSRGSRRYQSQTKEYEDQEETHFEPRQTGRRIPDDGTTGRQTGRRGENVQEGQIFRSRQESARSLPSRQPEPTRQIPPRQEGRREPPRNVQREEVYRTEQPELVRQQPRNQDQEQDLKQVRGRFSARYTESPEVVLISTERTGRQRKIEDRIPQRTSEEESTTERVFLSRNNNSRQSQRTKSEEPQRFKSREETSEAPRAKSRDRSSDRGRTSSRQSSQRQPEVKDNTRQPERARASPLDITTRHRFQSRENERVTSTSAPAPERRLPKPKPIPTPNEDSAEILQADSLAAPKRQSFRQRQIPSAPKPRPDFIAKSPSRGSVTSDRGSAKGPTLSPSGSRDEVLEEDNYPAVYKQLKKQGKGSQEILTPAQERNDEFLNKERVDVVSPVTNGFPTKGFIPVEPIQAPKAVGLRQEKNIPGRNNKRPLISPIGLRPLPVNLREKKLPSTTEEYLDIQQVYEKVNNKNAALDDLNTNGAAKFGRNHDRYDSRAEGTRSRDVTVNTVPHSVKENSRREKVQLPKLKLGEHGEAPFSRRKQSSSTVKNLSRNNGISYPKRKETVNKYAEVLSSEELVSLRKPPRFGGQIRRSETTSEINFTSRESIEDVTQNNEELTTEVSLPKKEQPSAIGKFPPRKNVNNGLLRRQGNQFESQTSVEQSNDNEVPLKSEEDQLTRQQSKSQTKSFAPKDSVYSWIIETENDYSTEKVKFTPRNQKYSARISEKIEVVPETPSGVKPRYELYQRNKNNILSRNVTTTPGPEDSNRASEEDVGFANKYFNRPRPTYIPKKATSKLYPTSLSSIPRFRTRKEAERRIQTRRNVPSGSDESAIETNNPEKSQSSEKNIAVRKESHIQKVPNKYKMIASTKSTIGRRTAGTTEGTTVSTSTTEEPTTVKESEEDEDEEENDDSEYDENSSESPEDDAEVISGRSNDSSNEGEKQEATTEKNEDEEESDGEEESDDENEDEEEEDEEDEETEEGNDEESATTEESETEANIEGRSAGSNSEDNENNEATTTETNQNEDAEEEEVGEEENNETQNDHNENDNEESNNDDEEEEDEDDEVTTEEGDDTTEETMKEDNEEEEAENDDEENDDEEADEETNGEARSNNESATEENEETTTETTEMTDKPESETEAAIESSDDMDMKQEEDTEASTNNESEGEITTEGNSSVKPDTESSTEKSSQENSTSEENSKEESDDSENVIQGGAEDLDVRFGSAGESENSDETTEAGTTTTTASSIDLKSSSANDSSKKSTKKPSPNKGVTTPKPASTLSSPMDSEQIQTTTTVVPITPPSFKSTPVPPTPHFSWGGGCCSSSVIIVTPGTPTSTPYASRTSILSSLGYAVDKLTSGSYFALTTPLPSPNSIPTRKSIPTKLANSRFVYALTPDNRVVRKIVHTTEAPKDVPFIIFGLYPNGTIVRRFPNGSSVPEEMTEANEVIGTIPNPKYTKEHLEYIIQRDKSLAYLYPDRFLTTTRPIGTARQGRTQSVIQKIRVTTQPMGSDETSSISTTTGTSSSSSDVSLRFQQDGTTPGEEMSTTEDMEEGGTTENVTTTTSEKSTTSTTEATTTTTSTTEATTTTTSTTEAITTSTTEATTTTKATPSSTTKKAKKNGRKSSGKRTSKKKKTSTTTTTTTTTPSTTTTTEATTTPSTTTTTEVTTTPSTTTTTEATTTPSTTTTTEMTTTPSTTTTTEATTTPSTTTTTEATTTPSTTTTTEATTTTTSATTTTSKAEATTMPSSTISAESTSTTKRPATTKKKNKPEKQVKQSGTTSKPRSTTRKSKKPKGSARTTSKPKSTTVRTTEGTTKPTTISLTPPPPPLVSSTAKAILASTVSSKQDPITADPELRNRLNDIEILNNFLKKEGTSGSNMPGNDIAERVIQLAIERAQKGLTVTPQYDNIQALASSTSAISTTNKLTATGAPDKSNGGKISVWVVPPEGEVSTQKNPLSDREVERLNQIFTSQSPIENLSPGEQLLFAELISSTGKPITFPPTRNSKKLPNAPNNPVLQALFPEGRPGILGNGAIWRNPQYGPADQAAGKEEEEEESGLVQAAINITRAVSQFMSQVIQGAVQNFQAYVSTRTHALARYLSSTPSRSS